MLDSFYAQYLRERTNDFIIENKFGFVTYRYLEDKKSVYIIDIFVMPEYRKDGHAGLMADTIVKEAKAKGITSIVGTVIPNTKNSTISLKVLLGYGMTLESSSNNLIVFRKEI